MLSRRESLKAVFGLTLFAPFLAQAKKKKKKKGKKGGDDIVMVKLDDPMAKGVKYVEDKKKTDKKLQIVRMGCSFEEQNCGNCMLKKAMDKKHNGKEVVGCTLFPGKAVYSEAWCQSWSKNPAAKCTGGKPKA